MRERFSGIAFEEDDVLPTKTYSLPSKRGFRITRFLHGVGCDQVFKRPLGFDKSLLEVGGITPTLGAVISCGRSRPGLFSAVRKLLPSSS